MLIAEITLNGIKEINKIELHDKGDYFLLVDGIYNGINDSTVRSRTSYNGYIEAITAFNDAISEWQHIDATQIREGE